jgi:hypothetical protein
MVVRFDYGIRLDFGAYCNHRELEGRRGMREAAHIQRKSIALLRYDSTKYRLIVISYAPVTARFSPTLPFLARRMVLSPKGAHKTSWRWRMDPRRHPFLVIIAILSHPFRCSLKKQSCKSLRLHQHWQHPLHYL